MLTFQKAFAQFMTHKKVNQWYTTIEENLTPLALIGTIKDHMWYDDHLI